ncbi:cell wall hydrolase [Sphingomonas sp. OK281]|uniref:cell wall hydrolase n=1 Tax=Sphingomonas sp. OK281 TaxID=1881067 RepID=UPI0008DECC8A|nr:cell wall hydrolase [Sphingomonas sp. OK281]SFO29102.1 Cell Wall Hydrolase [Sphingomonas sp. OK281]
MAPTDPNPRQSREPNDPDHVPLLLDPYTISTLPPVRRFHAGVLIPVMLAVILIVGSITAAILSLRQTPETDTAWTRTAVRAARIEAPFAPRTLRPLSPEQAVAWNAATPTVKTMVDPASAFLLRTSKLTDYQRSLQCLTMAVYYEAGSESDDGERGVAQVILNRVRHPAYPKTVCGVVYDGSQRRTGCQFTFICDGALTRTPNPAGWQRASRIATAALGGAVFAPVGWATHYHANYVVPYWAATLDKVAVIGAHIFYRWLGPAGRAVAFRAKYAGNEPDLPLPMGEAPTDAAVAAASTAVAGPPTPISTTERPVLTGSRAATTNDPSVPTVGLNDRRVLQRAWEPGGSAVTLPALPERRVLPASPTPGPAN